MDDKNSTYAVKLDGNVKEELLELLEGYKENTGANAGDFIKTLVEVYKTNKIVSKVSSTDADIEELNTLTSRIYNIYSNLIEKINSNNNALQQEFAEQLSQKDNSINKFKTKLEELEQENQLLKEAFNTTCEDKTQLEQDLQQTKELNNSYKLNISKLQDELTGLQQLKQVNSELLIKNEEYEKLLANSQSKNINLTDSIKEKDNSIDNLNKVLEELNTKHIEALKQTIEKEELIKEKAILDLQKNHQQELQQIQNKFNKEVLEYQDRYKDLLNKQEEEKKTRTKANKSKVEKKQLNI